jgi:hypothetical protein
VRWYWVAARCGVAGLLGWAAAWYSLFILLPVPMRWLGLGEWECVSLYLYPFPTLSVTFACFGFVSLGAARYAEFRIGTADCRVGA